MDLTRPNFGFHEHLVLTEVPLAKQNLLGKKLIEAGVLTAGTYSCAIDTKGVSAIDVYIEPTAVAGTGTPNLASYSLQLNPATASTREGSAERQQVTLDVAGGAPFALNTTQKLSLSGLNGTALCKVTFTLSSAVDFTPVTSHGRGEVRGL